MDYPINWAHQQDRRAETLVSHKKFSDAIVCHQKALEFLQEAMKMTEVKEALISLQLQCNNHCRQQRILKEKWKQWELEQEQRKHEQPKILQERQNTDILEKQNHLAVNANNRKDVIDGQKGTEQLQSSSLVISAENFSVSSASSICECGAITKDEKSTVQELEGQVRDLQIQVLSLTQNLEDCNRENRRLKKDLENVCEFVRLKFGCELEGNVFDCYVRQCEFENESETCTENDGLKSVGPVIKEHQTSSPEDRAQKNVEDDSGNNGKLDEDIPLPPLEEPVFAYECSKTDNIS